MAEQPESPLPPGWTKHLSPSGYYYFYNNETKESTYERPQIAENSNTDSFIPLYLEKPVVRSVGISAKEQEQWQRAYSTAQQATTDRQRRPRKKEIPKLMRPLDLEPWAVVVTNLGRPYVYNLHEKQAVWMPPPEVQTALERIPRDELILLIARSRGLKTGREGTSKLVPHKVGDVFIDDKPTNEQHESLANVPVPEADVSHDQQSNKDQLQPIIADDENDDDAWMYETDDEDDQASGGIIRQRNRTPSDDGNQEEYEYSESGSNDENENQDGVEEDLDYQMQQFIEENPDFEAEDDEEEDVSYEERVLIFRHLLRDLQINPYSQWETELTKAEKDDRFSILQTISERKFEFENWARERIAKLKEVQKLEPKLSPQDEFKTFLKQYATPRLFYVEFKRKHRKEPTFKNSELTDREKEKLYREHIDNIKKNKA
ncbi:hypothetical protein V1514DRAFT_297320 [Lipomyces japonicus]|uniref:uncharacterized protein n=1 Tax=Lipomyces japonicus TaxID=56871 RepID=UPI0034CEE58D